MDTQYWILTAYVIGTLTGLLMFRLYIKEWIVGETIAVLARKGVIAVEETPDGDLSVTAIPADVDTDAIVLKLIQDLEELQKITEEMEKEKDNEPEV